MYRSLIDKRMRQLHGAAADAPRNARGWAVHVYIFLYYVCHIQVTYW